MSFKLTKTQRKQAKTDKNNERLTTPQKSDALVNGYMKIMAILSRGCDVSAA